MKNPTQEGSLEDRRAAIDRYDFHHVHPNVHFGTASDRYAAWIGQIYPADRYANRISSRKRTLQGQTFEERQVPIASVRDYFDRFSTLELDFTFYRPLLEEDDEPSSNYFVLSKYADHAPADASFFVKAPRKYFARQLRKGGDFHDNPDFLDAEAYVTTFHEPALDILGDRLTGVIFQQEYQRVAESPHPDANVEALDAFFSSIPTAVQAHLELRSEHLLTSNYFDWLDTQSLGHVFSHWTWLPAIRKQWNMCGERFTAADGQAVSRLLTPRNMRYAEAYAKAYPFDEPKSELCETKQAQDMVLDATALVYRAEAQNALVNVMSNNRAWGNAPDLARTIAHRVLDEQERREAS